MENFNGQIDPSTTLRTGDVKVFNYALAASQIKTLYNNGAVTGSP